MREAGPERRSVADERRDATRRTYLANERTYLAWWRTGLTAMAVALGAGKLLPEITNENAGLYAVIGAGFAALGIVCVLYATRRVREVERAIARGEFVPLDGRLVALLAIAGALLGLMTMLVVTGLV
jgi:putative membrane protein